MSQKVQKSSNALNSASDAKDSFRVSVGYQGYEERVFEAQRSSNGEHWVEAAQQSPKQNEFANVRLHRQTSQVETQCCQILCSIQSILKHNTQTILHVVLIQKMGHKFNNVVTFLKLDLQLHYCIK